MINGAKQSMIFFFSILIIVTVVVLAMATAPRPRSKMPENNSRLMPPLYAPLFKTPMPPSSLPMATIVEAIPPPQQLKEPIAAINRAFLPKPKRKKFRATAQPQVVPAPPGQFSRGKMLPFQEAHWQGLEAIPLTKTLGQILEIPADAKGVILDDVTSPADMQGFMAGDLVTSVGQLPTPTLETFIKATDRVRDRRRAEVRFMRHDHLYSLVLTAINGRLGTANGETAPMIKPGSQAPHGYLGACTNCHRIGTTGQLPADQGDLLTKKAPPIRAGQMPPHRDRGVCTSCHKMIQ